MEEKILGEVEVQDKGLFIPVPNVTRAYGTEYYLNDMELAVLVAVGHHAWAWDSSISIVNVELLYSWLNVEVKNTSRIKKDIVTALLSLQTKGYITIDVEGEIKNTTMLRIHNVTARHRYNNVRVTVDNTTFTGFARVTSKMIQFAKLSSGKSIGQRLKVLLHIQWRDEIDYSISFAEWFKVLDVVKSTAENIIYSLRDEGLIEIISGAFIRDAEGNLIKDENGRPRQEMNRYFIAGEKPSHVTDKTYEPTAIKKHRRTQKITKEIQTIVNEGEQRIINFPSLTIFNSKLTEKDIELYMTTTSDTLIEGSQKRLKDIAKNEKGFDMLIDWEKKVLDSGVEVRQTVSELFTCKEEAGLTEEELEARRSIVGDFEEEEEDDYEIGSKEELDIILDSVEIKTKSEEDFFMSKEWLDRKRRFLDEYEDI